MIYLLLGGICAYLGTTAGLGAAVLLRPLLDAATALPVQSVAMLSTIAALGASLVGAFFALTKPLALHQDELILLAGSGALGGVLGDLVSARLMSMLPASGVTFLQNALLFAVLALPAVYFGMLSHTVRPLRITRLACVPAAFLIAILASFLAFGAQPVTIAVYYLLFDADDDEAAGAALTVSLTAMAGKLFTMLIRQRFALPSSAVLFWLLPGVLIGAAVSALLPARFDSARLSDTLLKLSLYTAVINIISSLAA